MRVDPALGLAAGSEPPGTSVTRTNRQVHRRALFQAGLAVAAMAIAMSAWSDGARASTPPGFVGTVLPFGNRCGLLSRENRCLSDQDLARLQEAHVRIVRWGFRWSLAQPLSLLPPN